MTDRELLNQYVEGHAEPAFAELVNRHRQWVYAVASRRVGDQHLAQDVTQAVFIVLSRKAASLLDRSRPMLLSAWLYQVVRLASSRALRDVARRRKHEAAAAAQRNLIESESNPDLQTLLPLVDTMLGSLRAADREAVLLRYYQQQTFPQVAAAIGVSEQAARKRVERAIAKMRTLLRRREGINITSAALAGKVLEKAASSAGAIAPSATAAPRIIADAVMYSLKVKVAASLSLATAACAMLVSGVVLLAPPSSAQNSPPQAEVAANIDPEAQRTMDAMYDAFMALQSCSWQMDYQQPADEPHFWGPTRTATVLFRRPNLAIVRSHDRRGDFWAISDGNNIASVKEKIERGFGSMFTVPDTAAKTYMQAPAAAGDECLKLALERGESDGFDVFRWMLAGVKPLELYQWGQGQSLRSLTKAPEGQVDGVATDTVVAQFQASDGRMLLLTFEIGREDHFLRRITRKNTPGYVGHAESILMATYSQVRINPDPPDAAFAINVPGMQSEPADASHSVQLVRGQDMPAFAGIDAYRGKTFILIFGPPNANRFAQRFIGLYEKYHARGLEVVSVVAAAEKSQTNLDPFPGEPNVRKVPWAVIQNADEIYKQYGITRGGLNVLVGKDGKIIAVDLPNYGKFEGSLTELYIRKSLGEQ